MNEQCSGVVFDIQHFSVGDGPGIRTTVFLKGCPLKCKWCHNPESQRYEPQIYFNKNRCIGCRKCEIVCENGCQVFNDDEHIFNSSVCDLCRKCVDVCPRSALELIGRKMSVNEVINEVSEDIPLYNNTGGITLSGGEPLFQEEFASELLRVAKEKGIHTCVETSGFCKNGFHKIAQYTDLFLFDYKATTDMHKELTGVDNEIILKNLFYLNSVGRPIILRCPIVPGENTVQNYFDEMISLVKQLDNIIEINLLPYHSTGTEKAEGLGIGKEAFKGIIPKDEELKEYVLYLQSKTKVKTVVL